MSEQAQNSCGSYYKHHIFFCLNERPADDIRGDCCQHGAKDAWAQTKALVEKLSLSGVRVNKSGCLGRCEQGPVCVVYPDNVWYTYVDENDLNEIVTEHLQQGRVVKRLLIDVDINTGEASKTVAVIGPKLGER